MTLVFKGDSKVVFGRPSNSHDDNIITQFSEGEYIIKLVIQNNTKQEQQLNLSVYCDQQIELKTMPEPFCLQNFIEPYYEQICQKSIEKNDKYNYEMA